MTIELIVDCTRPQLPWDSFVLNPAFSIALDGYVYGGPRFARKEHGPVANFNHHEEVDRLATRATCAQVLMAIRQGLFSTFRNERGPKANVFVNDCDEDVCTSWFLLKHGHMVENTMNPLLNRLVDLEDKLDSTAGAYPFPQDLPVLQQLAWVFYPYRSFRLNGGLDRKSDQEYAEIIYDVERRIMAHVTGNGGSIALDTRYEALGGGPGWTMIREVGGHAKTAMFSEGIRAYVSVRERPNGRYTYTVGRMSPFVRFDVSKILEALSAEEVVRGGSAEDRWGGGHTIGGSPRVGGSRLTPDEVAKIVRDAL